MNGVEKTQVKVVLGSQWYFRINLYLLYFYIQYLKFGTQIKNFFRGDEGKGKLVDLLAEEADYVVRCQVHIVISVKKYQ